ncbi:MAG: hydroxyacid dehydrogenase [Pseudomonadota bacterium]
MAKIVIPEFMDEASVKALAADYDTLYEPDLVARPDALIAAVPEAEALIVRNRTQVRGELLTAAKTLRVVGRLGVGLDNIDLAACEARGIAVCPASGANDQSVAEYVVAVALMLVRGAYGASDRVIAGDWPRTSLIGGELASRHLGLIGFGAIARRVAGPMRALGMTVAAHDPFVPAEDLAWGAVERLELDQLLAASDIVSLHVPLTDATRDLLDGRRIARMKPGAIVINSARGGLLDEAALAAALKQGHLAGAALDVFAEEPLSAAGAAKFAGLDNVILTPHIAGVTRESNVRVSAATARNVRRVLESTA